MKTDPLATTIRVAAASPTSNISGRCCGSFRAISRAVARFANEYSRCAVWVSAFGERVQIRDLGERGRVTVAAAAAALRDIPICAAIESGNLSTVWEAMTPAQRDEGWASMRLKCDIDGGDDVDDPRFSRSAAARLLEIGG